MPNASRKKRSNKELVVLLADRMALLMVLYWSKYGDGNPKDRPFVPLDEPDFWLSTDANELRSLPEYQLALETMREML